MMNIFLLALALLLVLLLLELVLYLLFPRKYQSADSVTNSYDDWTLGQSTLIIDFSSFAPLAIPVDRYTTHQNYSQSGETA
jgi:hypothetical protein